MSYTTALAQIKAVLQGVTGIGTVHDYARWNVDDASFSTLFVSSSIINFWTITRRETAERWDAVQHVVRRHTYLLRGYYGIDDSAATEKTFQSLVESVMTAFRTKTTLNNVAELVQPPQLEKLDAERFSGLLVHHARVKLLVEERVQAAPN
ncbi:MAG: hypothetical protein HYY96_01300 [Candidatus Tectomicrobia bacterium]|nr:hypothetical protein [Candidatus Tectomicrobia bacterium]